MSRSSLSSTASGAAARDPQRLDYVGFLHRVPFALDAYELGFVTGVREDYSLRQDDYPMLDVPVSMFDNDFRNPDLDRYREAFDDLDPEPRVAVLGDAYDVDDARQLVDAAREVDQLVDRDPFDAIVVPKSAAVLEAIPRDVTVGYPVGYSEITADDFSDPRDWAGRRVHILGGSPPRQYAAIEELTASTSGLAAFGGGVTDRDPADVIGVDWNGIQAIAYKGQYWDSRGSPHWRPADELSIRETVRKGLRNIKRFWRERDCWPLDDPRPSTSPYRDAAPADPVCACCGDRCETPAQIMQRDDGWVLGFCSESCLDRGQYRGGLTPLSESATR